MRPGLNFQQLPTNCYEKKLQHWQEQCVGDTCNTLQIMQSSVGSSRASSKAPCGSSGHTEGGRSSSCPVLLNAGATVQASGTSLKAPLSDLTNPFDSPHIFKDGRKFSKTPEIKYFLFPVMWLIIRGGLGKRIWDRFCITTDFPYYSKLLSKHLWEWPESFELKAVLIKCISRFSYI